MLELQVNAAAVQCWKWKLLTHFMNYNINAELVHNTSCNWSILHENFMMKLDSVWNVLGHHHRYGVWKFEFLALVITKYLVSMYVSNFFVCHNPYYMYMCVCDPLLRTCQASSASSRHTHTKSKDSIRTFNVFKSLLEPLLSFSVMCVMTFYFIWSKRHTNVQLCNLI